ncbi:hypothetical protein CPB97_004453, partial [Podila verticillata]
MAFSSFLNFHNFPQLPPKHISDMSSPSGFSAHQPLPHPANPVRDVGVVCLGDPSIPGPSPDEWARNHHRAQSLTLFAPTFTSMTPFKYDINVVKTLRELHVKHPVYLGLRLGAPPSHHWLHDMAARNRSLERLTLYGPGAPGVANTMISFKISNYFGAALPHLSIQSLTLRHFHLSDLELHNLLMFCPKLTRLELEHVYLRDETTFLLPHNGLQEVVLVKTTPTKRLIQVMPGVHTLVLKGDVDPPSSAKPEYHGTLWRIARDGFDKLVLGMPLLETVKVERVDFRREDLKTQPGALHDNVRYVFKAADIKLHEYFPNAEFQP